MRKAKFLQSLNKEEKDVIADAVIEKGTLNFTAVEYHYLSRKLQERFGDRWGKLWKVKTAVSEMRSDLKIVVPKATAGGRKPAVTRPLNEEIASILQCATSKILRAIERIAQDSSEELRKKFEQQNKEITELKAELRELKNIRESVERYQSRYVKR